MNMSESAGRSPAQRAAIRLYEWYRQPGPGQVPFDALRDWLSEGRSGAIHMPESLELIITRIGDSEKFAQGHQQLLQDWSARMEANGRMPDEATALGFLHDWLEGVDHGLIFGHALIAGQTIARAGSPADFVVSYYRNRSTWVLHLTRQGGAIYSGEKEFQTQTGDLLLIDPLAECHYQRRPDCATWTHDWVTFQPRHDWSRWMSWPTCSDRIYRCSVNDRKEFDQLADLSEQIRTLAHHDQRHREDLQYNLLEQLLIRASASFAAAPRALDPRVERACAFIRDNLGAPLTVAQFAAHCHVSASRLAHLFTDAMGISPQQFRNNLRMQRARKLLVTTNLPITVIAAEVGYSDAAQFGKYFSAHIGCSAREFRRQFARD